MRFAHLLRHEMIFEPSAMERVLAGTAAAPWSQRLLSPYIVKWIGDLGHLSLRNAAFILECVTLFAALLVFTATVRLFIRSERLAWLAGLSLLIPLAFDMLLLKFQYNWYVYDFPSLLFWVLFLHICLASRNLVALALIAALATANRESSVFLPLVYLLTSERVLTRDNILRTAVVAAAVVLVKVAIFIATTGGVGSGLVTQNHFTPKANLDSILRETLHNLQWLSIQAYGWLLMLLAYRDIPSAILKRLTWVVGLHFVAAIITGLLFETRIFADVAPLVWLVCIAIVGRWAQQERGAGRA